LWLKADSHSKEICSLSDWPSARSDWGCTAISAPDFYLISGNIAKMKFGIQGTCNFILLAVPARRESGHSKLRTAISLPGLGIMINRNCNLKLFGISFKYWGNIYITCHNKTRVPWTILTLRKWETRIMLSTRFQNLHFNKIIWTSGEFLEHLSFSWMIRQFIPEQAVEQQPTMCFLKVLFISEKLDERLQLREF
jgi:hypothetical protein